jgi:hypothetical protein
LLNRNIVIILRICFLSDIELVLDVELLPEDFVIVGILPFALGDSDTGNTGSTGGIISGGRLGGSRIDDNTTGRRTNVGIALGHGERVRKVTHMLFLGGFQPSLAIEMNTVSVPE